MSTQDSRKGVVILGATGSIGTNATAVAAAFPERFRVEAVTCAARGALLQERARQCNAKALFCAADPAVSTLRDEDQVCELIASDKVDLVLCAIQGDSATRQVLTALRAGKTVCLATKEVLVAAGKWVMSTAARHGGRILPVDSEHCALFQCLGGQGAHPGRELTRLILTCSGGPFHAHPEVALSEVTPQQALKHPTWSMGAKITLDSATLMNKAFEIVEAAWLYGVPEDKIQVVVHPQSIVHSMVEFNDGAVLAQLGPTDMRLPIQYCMTWPERCPALMQPLSFAEPLHLDFMPPDTRRFPALELARRALRHGGLAGAVLNAANDYACKRFLQGTLGFDEIAEAVSFAMERIPAGEADSHEAIAGARATAKEAVADFRSRIRHT